MKFHKIFFNLKRPQKLCKIERDLRLLEMAKKLNLMVYCCHFQNGITTMHAHACPL